MGKDLEGKGGQGLIFKDGRISTVDETFCLVFPVLYFVF